MQLNLINESEVMSTPEVLEAQLVAVEKHYRKRTRLTTNKLPEDLPVEVVERELPEDERVCTNATENFML